MKNTIVWIVSLLMALTVGVPVMAQSTYDLQKPFGFCTMSSRTNSSSTYNLTGGGGWIYDNGVVKDNEGNAVDASKIKVLKASEVTSDDVVKNAIKNYDVVIFDGSEGDFTISKQIDLNEQTGKTLLGINNARLCTKFVVTKEIRDVIADSGAHSASTSGGGGTLSNGQNVKEAAEFKTRQAIIDYTHDTDENYRKSGIFAIKSTSSNIIIRNIKFVGPGAIDAGGYDLISATGSKHVWVDHCEFTDGMDGNFDITNSADFFTVSWCKFSYTERSYMHQNTNLVGSSDDEPTGYLNTTFAYNVWDSGCNQRMPMARVGKIHLLNNYYNCAGASKCVNPRKNSEFLIEGNYFVSGITKSQMFGQEDAIAYVWKSDNVASVSLPSTSGSVTVPYEYTVNNATTMKDQLATCAGATLFGNNSGGGNNNDEGDNENPGDDVDNPDDGNEQIVIYSLVDGVGSAKVGSTGTINSSTLYTQNTKIVINAGADYAVIYPNSGQTFKTGDLLTVTGYTGGTGDGKDFGIYICTSSAKTTELYAVATTQSADSKKPVTGTKNLVLTKDASALYLFRYGGTGTNIVGLTVTRASANSLGLDETTESPEIVEGNYDEVTVSRTLKADTWNTFCVPFAMSQDQIAENFGADAEVKALNDVNVSGDNVLMRFVSASTIEAGVPYMVRVKKAVSEINVENVTVAKGDMTKSVASTDGTVLTFHGNYGKQLAPRGSYIINSNKFYYVDSDVNLKGYRGYFVVEHPSQPSNAKSLTFVVDEATAITTVNAQAEDSRAYNIIGQRVGNNVKGIVIINGKKVVR